MASKLVAQINRKECVACGVCANTCPLSAIVMVRGLYAQVNEDVCIGCRKCMMVCPASVIEMKERVSVVHV